ncbi:DUF3299 domain-containing protein [Roseibium alexandrii]
MRAISVLVCLLFLTHPATAAQTGLKWSQLIDPEAQAFSDPYAELSIPQLSDLAAVVRLRKRLASEDLTDDKRALEMARLEIKEKTLAKENIDIDWLLSQRWIVADHRKKAAWAVNESLDGQTIGLKGYFLMAGSLSERKLLSYLVPEIGMCAHVSPPNPNNLVRLELPPGTQIPKKLFTPVEVFGTLRALPKSISARVVDGPVTMASAWELSVQSMEVLRAGNLNAPSEPSKNWPVTLGKGRHVQQTTQ